ncbi:snaclec 1-like [Gigantopelta aegis]|uniref:snaclec 1-like n=1 Tax=Gigantopelta aegis TaxID=1735272 RepID=UPI001B88C1DC|nr:snaclec 1-like [Gigantopelta aegis]
MGGTCINLHNREVGGDTAHLTCKAEGARLLQIENHSTNTAIKTFLQTDAVLRSHSYYIGGRWSSSDARFVWEDGTLVDYDDWKARYPNRKGERRCILLKTEFNFQWKDNICLRKHWFICEFEIHSVN